MPDTGNEKYMQQTQQCTWSILWPAWNLSIDEN